MSVIASHFADDCWLCLFSFRKQLLPFLKVSTTIGNQALSHEIDAIYSLDWLTIRQITFLNGLRKNDIEAQVEFTFKVMERVTVTCYWCILTPYGAFQGWWTNNSNASYICTTIYQMLGGKPVAINLQVRPRIWTWDYWEQIQRAPGQGRTCTQCLKITNLSSALTAWIYSFQMNCNNLRYKLLFTNEKLQLSSGN